MSGLDYFYIVLLMLGSYLFANINFALIICKIKHIDIRSVGSGNPGTTNMMRALGLFWSLTTMFLDILKGAIPSLIGYLLYGDVGLYLCGISAVIGHIFPILLKFRGGKGVGCTCGMFLVANWWLTIIMVVFFYTFVIFSKKGSVGTLGFVLVMTLSEAFMLDPVNWICYILLAFNLGLIFIVHRKNIARLLNARENPTDIKGAYNRDMENLRKKHKNKEKICK